MKKTRVKTAWAAIPLALALTACANKPVPPDWQLDARNALQAAVGAYLEGKDRIADVEMARARQALGATARPDLLARAELVRCAAQVASLVLQPCTAYEALAVDAAPAEQAYAAYLYGRSTPATAALLPEQHRAAASGAAGALAGIQEPLARLVAAGALLQAGQLRPQDVALAVDTASAQGWRRPVLAWLGLQHKQALAVGDAAEAARLQRRIGLLP